MSLCNTTAERRGWQNACVDRAITCMFCHDLHSTLLFSALLQKDLFHFSGGVVKCLLFFRLQFINITLFLITEREVIKDLGLVLSE